MATRDLRLQRAQQAIDSIGLGFDITQDICFDYFKRGSRLIKINEEECRDLKIPGRISIPNVPSAIKCHAGESHRIQSGIQSFEKMSEHFNVNMSLGGKIPSGDFCASFGLEDAAAAITTYLAYDGWFITRYSFELERGYVGIQDHVKEAIPSAWDPLAMARFIERFGTHIVVGVRMGGKDVLYARQEEPSCRQPIELPKFLEDKADERFKDSTENCLTSEVLCDNKENIVVIYKRRGGNTKTMRHSEWLDTVDLEPDVISLLLLPLPTLLSGTLGKGLLAHAMNLYVKFKPPIEDLRKFLEFQLRKRWAPEHSDASFGSHWKNQVKTGLRLGILRPVLYINSIPAEVGNRPVTGLRLRLEGRRSNRLAINLQHLDSLPKSFKFSDKENSYKTCNSNGCKFHKKIKWNGFSYVCTACIESDDGVSIVTGAQLLVERNCILLRLRFSKVIDATLQRSPEWHHSCSGLLHHQGCCCIIIGRQNEPKPGEVTIKSSAYSVAHPLPVNPTKLGKFVDTSEIVRGPEHGPGYWVVSGAGLYVENGRINIRVKYSLLNFINSNVIAVP